MAQELQVKYDYSIIERCYYLMPYYSHINENTRTQLQFSYKLFNDNDKKELYEKLKSSYNTSILIDNNNVKYNNVFISDDYDKQLFIVSYDKVFTNSFINILEAHQKEHEDRRQELLSDEKFLKKLEKDIDNVFGDRKQNWDRISYLIKNNIIFKQ